MTHVTADDRPWRLWITPFRTDACGSAEAKDTSTEGPLALADATGTKPGYSRAEQRKRVELWLVSLKAIGALAYDRCARDLSSRSQCPAE